MNGLSRGIAASLVLALFMGVIANVSFVYADDNTTAGHWHSEAVQFKLESNLPDSWKNAIREAAEAWEDRTDITITENSSSINTIRRGVFPDSWQATCPPSIMSACTKAYHSNYHFSSASTIFNQNISMGTSSVNCALDVGTDVQSIAVHEFGHFAGWLAHSSDSGAAMYGNYNGCQRTPASHDEDSMDSQYEGH